MKRRALLALVLVGAAVFLPIAAAEQSAPSTATVTRLTPPTDGHAYFGFTFRLFDSSEPVWGDSRPFDERIRDSIQNELAGKKPAYLSVWTPWQHPDLPGKPLIPFSAALGDIAKVRSVVGEGGTIYLDWNITQTTPVNGGITTHDVAAGKLDAYIRRYARAVREYGQPLLVRLFNGEYNGSWWYGVSPKVDYRVTTGDFVKAWRRVVDIFSAVGATNVSWSWVVSAYPTDPGLQPGIDRDINAYWPGDDYVDWAGADFYDVGPPSWLDGPYAFAVAHHKPFFVGEFAIRHEWSGVLRQVAVLAGSGIGLHRKPSRDQGDLVLQFQQPPSCNARHVGSVARCIPVRRTCSLHTRRERPRPPTAGGRSGSPRDLRQPDRIGAVSLDCLDRDGRLGGTAANCCATEAELWRSHGNRPLEGKSRRRLLRSRDQAPVARVANRRQTPQRHVLPAQGSSRRPNARSRPPARRVWVARSWSRVVRSSTRDAEPPVRRARA
jgi:hypothetical protein